MTLFETEQKRWGWRRSQRQIQIYSLWSVNFNFHGGDWLKTQWQIPSAYLLIQVALQWRLLPFPSLHKKIWYVILLWPLQVVQSRVVRPLGLGKTPESYCPTVPLVLLIINAKTPFRHYVWRSAKDMKGFSIVVLLASPTDNIYSKIIK